MKRTLRLRKDVLVELTPSELASLAGGEATGSDCPAVRLTMPPLTCLFRCTEA